MASIIKHTSDIIHHPLALSFGLYRIKCAEVKCEVNLTTITVGNVAGWIPMIGTIIGAIHVIAGMLKYCEVKSQAMPHQGDLDAAKGMIGRGIAEFVGMGPLLALVDLTLTVARCIIPRPSSGK
ncbi:MAG TPA: hypothetical protein VIH61_04375 [Waddliaceae bacterium]